MPGEVKNIREWIYPESAELYQLLDKASRLKVNDPGLRMLPVFVCRRAHYTTFLLAQQLGIYIADARKQFILPRAEAAAAQLNEVQKVLGFDDLEQLEAADRLLLTHFRSALPKRAADLASNFEFSYQLFSSFAPLLRDSGLMGDARTELMDEFRRAAEAIPSYQGGW